MIDLWYFDVSIILFKNTELVRLKHRFDDKYFGGRAYRDLDPKNGLNDARVFDRTTKFIREELGFKFPLPVGPRTAAKIFRGAGFPSIEQWEQFCGEGYYAREAYHSDLTRFYAQQWLPRDFKAYWRYLEVMFAKLGKYDSIQNRAAYASGILRNHSIVMQELVERTGCGGEPVCPEGIERILKLFQTMALSYTPEHKVSTRKMLQASDTKETTLVAKKSKKKSKVSDNQLSLY